MTRRLILAFVVVVNLASAATVLYFAIQSATGPCQNIPFLDTWEHHKAET